MMWIIGMVIAAFFAGYLAKGIRVDEAYDEGYEDCIEEFRSREIETGDGQEGRVNVYESPLSRTKLNRR